MLIRRTGPRSSSAVRKVVAAGRSATLAVVVDVTREAPSGEPGRSQASSRAEQSHDRGTPAHSSERARRPTTQITEESLGVSPSSQDDRTATDDSSQSDRTDPRLDSVASTLAAGIIATFGERSGSTTSRLRAALLAADRWLREEAGTEAADDPGSAPERSDHWSESRADRVAGLTAGVSALFITRDEAILAQVGPALAARLEAGECRLYPAASPWLRPEPPEVVGSLWSPLGSGNEPTVHWKSFRPAPGATIILLGARAAELDAAQLSELLEAEATDIEHLLAEVLPAESPAMWLRSSSEPPLATDADASETTSPSAQIPAATALPGEAEAKADAALSAEDRVPIDSTSPAEDRVPILGTSSQQAPLPVEAASAAEGHKPMDAGPAAAGPPSPLDVALSSFAPVRVASDELRRLAASSIRLSARVLLGLLPDRAVNKNESRREEQARLAAMCALAIPVVVVALTLLMRTSPLVPNGRSDEEAHTSEGLTADVAEEPAAIVSATQPDVTAVASLPGALEDERHLVATADGAYVLNATRGRLDWYSGGQSRLVLETGDAVGDDLVGRMIDVFPLGSSELPNRIGLLDAADRVWSIDAGTVEPLEVGAQPVWRSAYRGGAFDGRMYVLDRGAGQIWRYTPTGGSYPGAGEPWLVDPAAELVDAVDLAIDGTILVLLRDGTIRRYNGGLEVPFEPRSVPQGIGLSTAVYASGTADRILVADRDHGRVVVLSRDGTFEAEIQPSLRSGDRGDHGEAGRFEWLHGVWWDEPTDRLLIAAGTTLYVASLE